MKKGLIFFLAITTLVSVFAFRNTNALVNADALAGAWVLKTGDAEQVLLFMDGYITHTTYDKATKKFVQTRGGTYTLQNGQLTVHYEFDTQNKEAAGQAISYIASVKEGHLRTDITGDKQDWKQLDKGVAPLSGLWAITARKQNGELQTIHQTGTRKTVKILTGSRFQWAAIDPGTKQFMGTGGGTYTFQDGRYTEHIEFFSRDSSRVGSSLSFDGKLQEGAWHHSGLSSRGEPIYEVWSRKK